MKSSIACVVRKTKKQKHMLLSFWRFEMSKPEKKTLSMCVHKHIYLATAEYRIPIRHERSAFFCINTHQSFINHSNENW